MLEKIKNWLKGQWAMPKKRPQIIVLGLCCSALLIGGFVLLFLLIRWLIFAVIIPVIGIVILFIFFAGDKLVDNYNANQAAQQIAEQQQAAAAQAVYYEILRGIVLPALVIMVGKQIYGDLCVYDGPYLYGPGEIGPIYYYEISPEHISFADKAKKKELRSRLKRKIAKKYHMPLSVAKYCVITGTGIDGVQLVLVSLDPSVLPKAYNDLSKKAQKLKENSDGNSESRVC